jgi:hypothetical protein
MAAKKPKQDNRLISEVSGFNVASRADGTITVYPHWLATPIEPGATPVGVFTRMWMATRIDEILRAEIQREHKASMGKRRE